jgi:Co/Zn/Cd efflux system component
MQNIKKIYLYLVSVIALVIWVVGAIMLINMGLKTWLFPKADNMYYSVPCMVQVKSPDGAVPATECDEKARLEQERINRENAVSQKQRDAAQAVAMILVATPVWFFHWRLAKREA